MNGGSNAIKYSQIFPFFEFPSVLAGEEQVCREQKKNRIKHTFSFSRLYAVSVAEVYTNVHNFLGSSRMNDYITIQEMPFHDRYSSFCIWISV